jgi:ABC-type Na+ efflux pump permease subunit
LKNKIFGYKNILLSIGIILLVVTLTYGYFNSQKSVIYNVAIIDYDLSSSSITFIEDLKEHNEINLSVFKNKDNALNEVRQGNYDILYVIDKGFENSLKNGNFEDIISYNFESTMKITSWLNDYIALKVLKKWVYYDIHNLINEKFEYDYSIDEYNKLYEQEYNDNSIIGLEVESTQNNFNPENENKRIFVLIFGVVVMYITMSFGKEIINERDNKIINRLEVSDISLLKYLIIKLVVLTIFLLISFICSYIALISLKVLIINEIYFDLLKFILFIFINYLIILLFIIIFKDNNKYILFSQCYLLISILVSSNVFKGTFDLINKVSVFFPLTTLIEKL